MHRNIITFENEVEETVSGHAPTMEVSNNAYYKFMRDKGKNITLTIIKRNTEINDEDKVRILLYTIANTHFPAPQAFTKRDRANAIEPPSIRYVGIALTDASMNPRNGDTAVTINHFSALTVDNGPFTVYNGDLLMWTLDCDMHNFDENGIRAARGVLTWKHIYTFTQENGFDEVIRLFQYIDGLRSRMYQKGFNKRDIGRESRGKYATFNIIPYRNPLTIQECCSYTDDSRVFAKAISSAEQFQKLDIVNGREM